MFGEPYPAPRYEHIENRAAMALATYFSRVRGRCGICCNASRLHMVMMMVTVLVMLAFLLLLVVILMLLLVNWMLSLRGGAVVGLCSALGAREMVLSLGAPPRQQSMLLTYTSYGGRELVPQEHIFLLDLKFPQPPPSSSVPAL